MAVGKVRSENRVVAASDGSPLVEERKFLRVNYTFDDRIADGVYMGKALELVRRFVEDPSLLAIPEELSPGILAELALRPSAIA
jgi:pyruvate/2-oxoglutarate dehydrogenase complex dihydrolipoamide acyltransferase (E2) component